MLSRHSEYLILLKRTKLLFYLLVAKPAAQKNKEDDYLLRKKKRFLSDPCCPPQCRCYGDRENLRPLPSSIYLPTYSLQHHKCALNIEIPYSWRQGNLFMIISLWKKKNKKKTYWKWQIEYFIVRILERALIKRI